MLTAIQIDETITSNLDRLRKPGVLTVRPGYEIAGRQLTGKRAIVATVHTKTADLSPDERLPESIEGVPVDVREASAHQRLRRYISSASGFSPGHQRRNDGGCTLPVEREMPSGLLLASDCALAEAIARSVHQIPHLAPVG